MSRQSSRISAIIEILQSEGAASTRELSSKLDVTEMTIRRDLQRLSRENIIRIIHGGAIYIDRSQRENSEEYCFTIEEVRHRDQKIRIGRRAATFVEPGDTVIFDTGTTTEFVARAVPRDMEITVLCYSLNTLNYVCCNPKWRSIIPGGHFHLNTLMFESAKGVEMIRSVRANKAFIAASGVSSKLGITCTDISEVDTKKAAIGSSNARILVADSSKFGEVRVAHFAELEDFTAVVTDAGIPEEYAELIREKGVQLHTV